MRKILTKNKYDLFEVASTIQKAIRRGDKRIAGYFALELFASGYHNYCWKRLLTISAEDVLGVITQEIAALHYSFTLINTPKKDQIKGRIFISKAVSILCDCYKSRETDHLQNFVYDMTLINHDDVDQYLEEVRKETLEIPEWAYDVHTMRGKRMGKTKKHFFIDEQDGLFPKASDEFLEDVYQYIDQL